MDRTGPLATIAASLRRERERLGLSLTELARRAGVAKSTLSQLESGAGNPSVETLWALAVVLDVPFSRLVDPPVAAPVRVIRAGERVVIPSDTAPFTGTLIAACPPGARRDLHVITGEPGPARTAHAHINGTTEHMLVTAGRWRAGPLDSPVELALGDYARFPGDREHTYEALEAGSAAVLVMEYV
jgi:transcriptional regulator with XRE-family HTH domain